MSLFASRSSHWSSRTSTQRARVKSEGMSTRSRRLRWWEGGSQWEASQGSHARCAGSVRAVVGSGQGGQAHPSCPGSARVPALRTRRNPALVEYIVLVHWVYRIQSTPSFFRKRSGQMANRSRTALIYFSRAHTTEVSPSAGGISFRRKRITNERGGQAHPCDGCHRTQPSCPRQILGYTGRRHLTHELDIQHVGITRSWRWDISTPLDVTGGLGWLNTQDNSLVPWMSPQRDIQPAE